MILKSFLLYSRHYCGVTFVYMNSKAFPKIHLVAILLVLVVLLLVAFWPSSDEPEPVVVTLSSINQPYQESLNVPFYSNVSVTNNAFTEENTAAVESNDISNVFNNDTGIKNFNDIKPAEPEKIIKPPKLITVKKQDTLSHIFERSGAGVRLMMNLLNNKSIKETLTPIKPGETIEFHYDEQEQVVQVHLVRDVKHKIVITGIVEKKYIIEERITPSVIKSHFKSAAIESSLFGSAEKAGMNANLTAQVMHIFGWDIDFGQDLRKGDHLGVLYEQEYIGGQPYGKGKVVAAQFFNKGKLFQSTLYTDASGRMDYYNEKGNSMKKSFLRTPVDAARISSGFTNRRFHPVHKIYRPHRGTDYAAPAGTPIKASGDGKVIFVGAKGGYGNTVILQHQQGITTLYAHMKGFRKGMKVGKRVNQGEVIGYVGTTGSSTGNHLHYEFRVNGVHKDPETVELPKAEPINKKYLADYIDHSNFLLNKLNAQRIALQEFDNTLAKDEIL